MRIKISKTFMQAPFPEVVYIIIETKKAGAVDAFSAAQLFSDNPFLIAFSSRGFRSGATMPGRHVKRGGGMHEIKPEDLEIKTLGECKIDSSLRRNSSCIIFTRDEDRILYHDELRLLRSSGETFENCASLEMAGPREKIYFDASKCRAGVVTCGGLCPGLNDVIRAITLELWYNYGVRAIHGFRYGYQGFIAKYGHETMDLNPKSVDGLQDLGGTVLGSSRGPQEPSDIADCLERMGINMLFAIGGDGTQRGGLAISRELEKRNLKVAVVGVPKTIDNDLQFVDESFGFQTAFSAAHQPVRCAHVEAAGTPNGVGLIKLMGRHSGFIACYAAMAMSDVNYVLIPEVPFKLQVFLSHLKERLQTRHHAVIVVAEGAGQDLMASPMDDRDASGNVKLKDIGVFLKKEIVEFMKTHDMECDVKYIDPSYIIRSVPANAQDSIYCSRLGHSAVHAAMAGKTEMIVGRWGGEFVHIPVPAATSSRKQVDPAGTLWRSVLETTGMPARFE